jgi:ribosomal protein L11 methyltransferase
VNFIEKVMKYSALTIKLDPSSDEFFGFISALLDQHGFEGIYEDDKKLVAYIPKDNLTSAIIDSVINKMAELGCKVECVSEDIAENNWNELWESNFEPVIIDDLCVIKAPFHEEFPDIKYRITIEPKMSFGTGHHQTTRMMLEKILELDMTGKCVLDMGCGTGVLSILASMKGAFQITAIDIDKWAVENTKENIQKNKISNIKILMGGKDSIPDEKYDIILANINRNIILDQMSEFARVNKKSGLLLISGILAEDVDAMKEKAQSVGFNLIDSNSLSNWSLLMFERN